MFLVLLAVLIGGGGCDVEEEVVVLRKERPLHGLPEKSPRRLSLNKSRYGIHEKLALLPCTNKDNELFFFFFGRNLSSEAIASQRLRESPKFALVRIQANSTSALRS
jgi:hypothetical protein